MKHASYILRGALAVPLSLALIVAGDEAFAQGGAQSITVFSTDFNSGAPSQFSGVTTTESVQGYAGIGTGADVFSGDFLRNSSVPPLPTTLTLTGLPAHTSIDLNFLLAIVDSWDGIDSPCCGPDTFTVTVDGNPVFTEVFNNAVAGGTQSYIPPPGVELVRMAELGFRDIDEHDQDSGYDMNNDPAFANIPHTSSTLTIEWYASGPGWQGDDDESWAIDNVEVILNGVVKAASGCGHQWTWSHTLEFPPGFWEAGFHQYDFLVSSPQGTSYYHWDFQAIEDAPLHQGQAILRYWVVTSADGPLTEVSPAQDTAMQLTWIWGPDELSRKEAEAFRASSALQVRWDGGEWVNVPAGPLTKGCAWDNPGHFQRSWGHNY